MERCKTNTFKQNKIENFLDDFFSNIKETLGIPNFNQSDPVSDKVNDPLTKAILKCRKYRTYPILAIKKKKKCESTHDFHFLMLY